MADATAQKSSAKKKPAKKATAGKLVSKKPTFKLSGRKVFQVPLNMISNNPGNPGDLRDREVIPALYEQGYRVFPQQDIDEEHTLWAMLNGKDKSAPDANLRGTAVQLISEYEPEVVDFANSIVGGGMINPIQVVVLDGRVGIESGSVRALAQSFLDAQQNRPPSVIDAEVATDRDLGTVLARAAVENLNVISSDPICFAQRLKLARSAKKRIRDIAKMVGRSEETVRNYLRLLETPQDVQNAVSHGDMTMQSALEMAKQSRQEGRDIEEIADEQSPTRGNRQSKKSPKKHKMLTFDKSILIYISEIQPPVFDIKKMQKKDLVEVINQQHDRKLEIMRELMQISPEEAAELVEERASNALEMLMSDAAAALILP